MEFELVKKIVAEVMKVDIKEVTTDTTFVDDLGADSLDLMRIVMNTEEQFTVKLDPKCIYDITKVADLLTLIKKVK